LIAPEGGNQNARAAIVDELLNYLSHDAERRESIYVFKSPGNGESINSPAWGSGCQET